MDRVRWTTAGAAVAGAAMVMAAFAGVGNAATTVGSATPYKLIPKQFDYYSGKNVTVRWAPCIRISGTTRTHVIHYKVNPAGHSSRVRLAKRAVAKLSNASGLTFAYDGRTNYVPRQKDGVFQALEQERQTGVPLVVAWARKGTGAGESNLLTQFEAGVGTVSWRSSSTSQLRINDAAVVIKPGAAGLLDSGFLAGGSIGALMLHELGHAVGLEHADPGQIMYPIIGATSPANYASGDRQGLSKVGLDAGCMTTKRLPAVNHF